MSESENFWATKYNESKLFSLVPRLVKFGIPSIYINLFCDIFNADANGFYMRTSVFNSRANKKYEKNSSDLQLIHASITVYFLIYFKNDNNKKIDVYGTVDTKSYEKYGTHSTVQQRYGVHLIQYHIVVDVREELSCMVLAAIAVDISKENEPYERRSVSEEHLCKWFQKVLESK